MKMVSYNSAALRKDCRKITTEYLATEEFKNNISNMLEIFKQQKERGGVALAAPQVGWNVRLFLMLDQITQHVDTIINPAILHKSKKTVRMQEGCLSFPGMYLNINRPETITWEYSTSDTPDLKLLKETVSGFIARVIQHETDHINGKLFIDRASTVQKLKIKKWIKRHK